ncbi:calcium-binding protein, partial [Candidatus Kaiserbacteria bacterium]|nr:calcium-binding protein [Candidatus Kaiserbacteria bacterium]
WQPWDANWGSQQNNWTGNNNYRGGILNDVLDASRTTVGTPTYNTTINAWQSSTGWFSNRDWLEGGLGNDTLYGGDGADQLQGGKGNDVLDGGANPALDPQRPWETWDKYDEARFTNSIKRYDIQFYRAQEGGGYDNMGHAKANGGYVKSGYYAADGFIVAQDRYSDALGGEGRDVVRNVERLTFSDAWEDLSFGYQDTISQQQIWNGTTHVTIDVTSRWAAGTRFGDKMVGLADAENRFEARAGDDYLVGGNLRDELEGGQGDDTLDGGANPAVDPSRPWETWDKFDVARYNAISTEFQLRRLTDGSGSKTGIAGKTYYEIQHLIPSKLGGLGTDIVFNVERIQFNDKDVPLDVKVDSWTYTDDQGQQVTS